MLDLLLTPAPKAKSAAHSESDLRIIAKTWAGRTAMNEPTDREVFYAYGAIKAHPDAHRPLQGVIRNAYKRLVAEVTRRGLTA